MTTIDRKIRELRRRRNLTQGEFADAIGVKQSTVSRWESGAQEPEFSAVMRIAEWANMNAWDFAFADPHAFNKAGGARVPVVGLVKANEWLENHLLDNEDRFEVEIPLPDDFIHTGMEGYIIKDNSCEPLYRENSIVFINKRLGFVQHEVNVIVVRNDQSGLCEVTLREVYINRDGVIYLSPITDDPSISTPFRVKSADHHIHDGYDEVDILCIQGPVIASFTLEPKIIEM